MMALAIDGGKPAISRPLRPYNTIGNEEVAAAERVLRTGPLSGFLGGERHGGYHVTALEQEICDVFGSRYAIAVNSATSGLLCACMACGVGPETNVVVPALTMSATAATPAFLGANIIFCDVEKKTFTLTLTPYPTRIKKPVIMAVNLFGHAAFLHQWMECADVLGGYVIEDNSQAIFAEENGRYAGTIGHIGVFSGNTHKALNCGEGGICVTNDDELADKMRLYRNHAELAGSLQVGLNLRMTELEAAIMACQLKKGRKIIEGRIEQAEFMTDAIKNIPGLYPPTIREGCTHVYYVWAITMDDSFGMTRHEFVRAMRAEGVPLVEGYLPINRLPAFKKFRSDCPTAENLHERSLVIFENCMYSPSREQRKEIRNAFHKVAEHAQNKQRIASSNKDHRVLLEENNKV